MNEPDCILETAIRTSGTSDALAFTSISAKQYFPLTLPSAVVATARQLSKSPSWLLLPLRRPGEGFADASHTATNKIFKVKDEKVIVLKEFQSFGYIPLATNKS